MPTDDTETKMKNTSGQRRADDANSQVDKDNDDQMDYANRKAEQYGRPDTFGTEGSTTTVKTKAGHDRRSDLPPNVHRHQHWTAQPCTRPSQNQLRHLHWTVQ